MTALEDINFPWYHRAVDLERVTRDFPPPPDFFRGVFRASRDELRALQERRFLQTMKRGWEIPFYQRLWGAAGMQPGDVRGLDDLPRIPAYTVEDIRRSIEANPPFGDFMGVAPGGADPMPLVLQTSGGTTGLPRPMLYAPQDREVMAILGARRYAMQGMLPGDMVLVAFSLGLTNGGLGNREILWKYMGAVPVMTGSGATTPTRRQIELCKAWGINVVLAFPAYLRHMALVARDEMGIDVRDLKVRMLGSHIGLEDRKTVEELWGAPCYDSYGTHENGTIATECKRQDGMHINDDCFVIEIVDPDSDKIQPDGERGTVHITTLFRHSAPQIRFNINDISSYMTGGDCPCGCSFRRLTKIYGRNDNMVKVRGVNVFTEAIGVTVAADRRSNGEFFCVIERLGESGRDELTVMVEVPALAADGPALKDDLERRLREVIGLRTTVTPVAAHALDDRTGLSQTSKIKRLLDKRKVTA
jgi:phenylacetate-CoA ligase